MPTIDEVKKLFEPFLRNHPKCAIEEIPTPKGQRLAIKKPWGEDGLVFLLPDRPEALADALNNLVLPEPFTAIWHGDTKAFEVIWTAYPRKREHQEIEGRKFVFEFEGNKYDCEFGRSSDRLLLIADCASPLGISGTQHRNLPSFSQYLYWQEEAKRNPKAPTYPGTPISFWIKAIDWDEARALRLARHLNFYLKYYDDSAPTILIHTPNSAAAQPRTRYIYKNFPKQISARNIEDDLLHFWAACHTGDTARRFVYCWRIIEYASYAYVDSDIRIKIKRLLAAPHAMNDIEELGERVIATAGGAKPEDVPRVRNLLVDAVDPGLLWREISLNRSAFENDTLFDGGYSLDGLITSSDTETTFKKMVYRTLLSGLGIFEIIYHTGVTKRPKPRSPPPSVILGNLSLGYPFLLWRPER